MPEPKRHLLITGTGRAGTSFLVRYLDALGFETHFSRFGEHATWDEAANAGAENLPLSALDDQLPYVVKSPWAGEFIDQVLADPGVALDAVVIPMRDLDDAAASRAIVELRDIVEHNDFMTKLDQPWAHRGPTPGGIVYSLHPLDQARILALGFHHLVERLTAADVPIVFLNFPRLALDADYLHAKLAPVLPKPVTAEAARAAHAELADPAKIRVEAAMRDTTIDRLERVALAREIERLRARIGGIEEETENLRREAENLRGESENLRAHAARIEESTMWRALAPLRAALHRMRNRG
ncbi:MAG: hypothetical protein ACYCZB_17090 [Acidiphilium sp.]